MAVPKDGTSPEMQALIDQATANESAEQSAIDLLNNLAARVLAAAGDKVATTAIATELKASADALGAAVVANTPAA